MTTTSEGEIRSPTETSSPSTRPHVGTYVRELPVSLERLYENALDWEHLPYLHSSSFYEIECVDAGKWGWRAWVGMVPRDAAQRVLLELRLDRRCRRWITRTLEGAAAGAEIWTHAFAMGERRTDVVVDFFVPNVCAQDAEAVGRFYEQLYAQLYDEDVAMMAERQIQLDRAAKRGAMRGASQVVLGTRSEIGARLPFEVDMGGQRFRIVDVNGELVVHALLCPHLLGPLDQQCDTDGTIECPWHGYRFDVSTGECVSGQRCRLSRPPRLVTDPATGALALAWPDPS